MIELGSSSESFVRDIPPLEYGELLRINSVSPILKPNEIPVHPMVYESSLVYTSQFAQRVAAAVPDSIKEDMAVIKRVLGHDLKLEVDQEGIQTAGGRVSAFKHLFASFDIMASPGRKTLDVAYGSANIAVGSAPEGCAPYRIQPFSFDPHPMSAERLKIYGFDPEVSDSFLHVWYIHNLSTFGDPGLMYFRNFAIMFNNLGLQEINNSSK